MLKFEEFCNEASDKINISVPEDHRILIYPRVYVDDLNDEYNNCIEEYDVGDNAIELTFKKGTSFSVKDKIKKYIVHNK